MGTYNVIEAAMKLGIRKVIIASSETTYGVCFAEGDKDFHSFPLEEDYDIDPMDSYGLSKVVNEKTARAFAMRYGRRHLCAAHRQRHRAARIWTASRTSSPIRRCASATPGATSTRATSARSCISPREGRPRLPGVQRRQRHDHGQHADRRIPGALSARMCRSRAPLGEFEAPLSNRKIREVLGFREEHNWRKYVAG